MRKELDGGGVDNSFLREVIESFVVDAKVPERVGYVDGPVIEGLRAESRFYFVV